jgi:hypothetical protein
LASRKKNLGALTQLKNKTATRATKTSSILRMAIFVLSTAFFHFLAKVRAINDMAGINTHYEWLLVAKRWLD